MPKREHILYKGTKFTIEWYCGPNGKSQARDYFEKLNRIQKIKFLRLVEVMGKMGVIRNRQSFNSEGDGLYVFKPQPDRFLCFFYVGKKIVVTNAFHKKTQKLPKQERERALKHREDYEMRVRDNLYYE